MSGRQRIAAMLVTALSMLALGWAARAPYVFRDHDHGVLRLSWRLRGERVERCRARTAAELAELPVHMRAPEVCEGYLVAYRLRVEVDGELRDSVTIVPGGARGDRPIFVFRELPLAAGDHRVRVSLARADTAGAPLTLDTGITARAGAVELITLDGEARRLVHRGGAGRHERDGSRPVPRH